MKFKVLKYLFVVVLCLRSSLALGKGVTQFVVSLIGKIPSRPPFAMKGSDFAQSIARIAGTERENAILGQLLEGNIPDFLKGLKPVSLIEKLKNGKTLPATIFVMPDYLAIGSDEDFVSMPMGLATATRIAARFGFILPTRKMVNAIFEQANVHFAPQPMTPGPEMISTAYYLKHSQTIQEQRRLLACPLDALVSGGKKDVVITNLLARALGRVAIYGWHRPSGIPIQPLSTVHGSGYADYSHGIRLVSEMVLVDGRPRSVCDVLEDPGLAVILSDEGAIPQLRQFMTCHPEVPAAVADAARN
jgi:hypothetical protein